MILNIEMIISLVTAVVGYIFGELSKKFNWVEKKYLPLQTLVIGLIAGILYYIAVDSSNIATAIIIAFSSLMACGTYDLLQTKKED